MKKKYTYVVGIDTGVKTGLAVWEPQKNAFKLIETVKIHQAMSYIDNLKNHCDPNILVRVEDARKRNWFAGAGREKLQGAGSVKRDAVIWQDYLDDLKVDYEMVAPKNNKTKLSPEAFKKVTGWQGRTSEHARDGAMLCFKISNSLKS